MESKLFASLLGVFAIICLHDAVNAEFCPDHISAGKCFDENIAQFGVAVTTGGFVFSVFLVILSFCLFCKTKVNGGDVTWVHDREPRNWEKDCEDLSRTVNNGYRLEQRQQDLGEHSGPQHFVSDRSLYSERATTSAFPASSNASEIMNAIDGIEDEEAHPSSGYHWAPASLKAEKECEYEMEPSRSVVSAQILHHKKPPRDKRDEDF